MMTVQSKTFWFFNLKYFLAFFINAYKVIRVFAAGLFFDILMGLHVYYETVFL